ncbi:Endothelial lipase [Folsomia candida]|uniref:Endothelial lipase n=1 Tax=Folsomia candida TaxID=158441 RepID=A0A226EWJ7_FOLCA|nr:Endothelial lipase [Folsomia candida]
MTQLHKYFLFVFFINLSHSEISRDTNLVKFVYYGSGFGRNESGTEIDMTSNSKPSLIRDNAKTTFVIDGFLSHGNTPMSQTIKDALVKTRPSENVIVIDWGALSGSGNPIVALNLLRTSQTYLFVLGNVGPVGRKVAEFVNYLAKVASIEPSQMHVIGHSLGAHIAGAVGFWATSDFGKNMTLGRITGLDPAGPFFSGGLNMDRRLSKGDATFVDIYHTNRNGLGDSDHRLGDVDVYVNGGDNQPGCGNVEKKGAFLCSEFYNI